MTTENDWLVAIHEESERALAQGEARGEAIGRAEGRAEGIRQTAVNLKSMGMPVSDIAKATGLPEDEVKEL